jgi:hypothetical protein
MSRVAAKHRWQGWRTWEVPLSNDPGWVEVTIPKARRPKCPSCVSNSYPVTMRAWGSPPSFRCPCCGFAEPVDEARFERIRRPTPASKRGQG